MFGTVDSSTSTTSYRVVSTTTAATVTTVLWRRDAFDRSLNAVAALRRAGSRRPRWVALPPRAHHLRPRRPGAAAFRREDRVARAAALSDRWRVMLC